MYFVHWKLWIRKREKQKLGHSCCQCLVPYLWVGVEKAIRSGAEKSVVGVEASPKQLRQKLPEHPSTINPRLIQALNIHQVHPQLLTEVWRVTDHYKSTGGH